MKSLSSERPRWTLVRRWEEEAAFGARSCEGRGTVVRRGEPPCSFDGAEALRLPRSGRAPDGFRREFLCGVLSCMVLIVACSARKKRDVHAHIGKMRGCGRADARQGPGGVAAARGAVCAAAPAERCGPHALETDRPGERGAPPGHKEGIAVPWHRFCFLGCKAGNRREGSLPIARHSIGVGVEKRMIAPCSSCVTGANGR